MITTTVLVISLVIGIVMYLDARTRTWPEHTMSVVGWGLVGVFAGIFAIPFYMLKRERSVPRNAPPMRRCPHCPALMPLDADVCPTCGRGLDEPRWGVGG